MTINCKGKLVDLSKPKVMGILNITPDSFYDGGKYHSNTAIISQVRKMLLDGATFIDIGAYSSRPNAKHISVKEEISRIIPIVELLINEFPNILISIDTFRGEVAKVCLEKGACMINDISAGDLDKKMFQVIANYQVPYIIMHMLGNPQTMQSNINYEDIIMDIRYYFSDKIEQLTALKVNDVILDVGFGFGKTLNDNYNLLQNMDLFSIFELPILAGISRKSMLYNLLDSTSEKMLNATSIANFKALEKGASILRVHDVKEAVECVKIFEKLRDFE